MAAFAKVKLTEDGRLHGVDYKEGDVLRLETATARRLLANGKATAYNGTAKGKNEKELN